MQVVLDGVTTSIELDKDKNVPMRTDAGLDAPYSCLGGVVLAAPSWWRARL